MADSAAPAERGLLDALTGKPTLLQEDPALLAPVAAHARALALWHRPARSATALAAALAATLAARWYAGDLLRVALGALFGATLLNVVYAAARKAVAAATGSDSLPAAHRALGTRATLAVSEADARRAATAVVTVANGTLRSLAAVVLAEDLAKSAAALVGLYIAWTLASWMATSTLVLLGLAVAFVVPVAYDRNREVIDVQRAVLIDLTNQKLGFVLERSRELRADLSAKLTAATTATTTPAAASSDDAPQHPKEE